MNTRSQHRPVPSLQEQALRRAQELRSEAIDDFWRGADAAWAATLGGARRSAQRLAHALGRHAQARRKTSSLHRLGG